MDPLIERFVSFCFQLKTTMKMATRVTTAAEEMMSGHRQNHSGSMASESDDGPGNNSPSSGMSKKAKKARTVFTDHQL